MNTKRMTENERLRRENERLRQHLDLVQAKKAALADLIFWLVEDHVSDLVDDRL